MGQTPVEQVPILGIGLSDDIDRRQEHGRPEDLNGRTCSVENLPSSAR
jgi:hypothetical protein